MHPHLTPTTGFGKFIDRLEEDLIALILALMTAVTFANVIARYVFNTNILWALELTVYLFAWLVLLGASYGVKKNLHIGVDVILNMLPDNARKYFTYASVSACIIFSILLTIGAWEYWYPFVSKRAWYEVNDIPMPYILTFLEGWLNEGEAYEKIPRLIPYMVMPISMALLTYRFIQAFWQILKGERNGIIAAHEAEELLEEVTQAQSEGNSNSSSKGEH